MLLIDEFFKFIESCNRYYLSLWRCTSENRRDLYLGALEDGPLFKSTKKLDIMCMNVKGRSLIVQLSKYYVLSVHPVRFSWRTLTEEN